MKSANLVVVFLTFIQLINKKKYATGSKIKACDTAIRLKNILVLFTTAVNPFNKYAIHVYCLLSRILSILCQMCSQVKRYCIHCIPIIYSVTFFLKKLMGCYSDHTCFFTNPCSSNHCTVSKMLTDWLLYELP